MTTSEAMAEVVKQANLLRPIVVQYVKGTITLADGTEAPLSTAQINQLKVAGLAAKTALIAAAQDITG